MQKLTQRFINAARSHIFLSLVICGALGGFLNGLLGAGSGIIFIFALNILFSDKDEKPQQEIFALSLGAVFFVTLFSVFFYAVNGNLRFAEASPFIVPAAVGGLIGAVLLERLDPSVLKLIFSIVIIYSGITMLR